MIDFQFSYLIIILQLVILEGLLSFDNAVALAAFVKKRLKNPKQQQRALLYGILGAYILRTMTIFLGVWLMKHEWTKAIAGLYLIFIATSELFFNSQSKSETNLDNKNDEVQALYVSRRSFILIVCQIELMDLMFSIDSIAVALAISNVKWVLITGAVIGILTMRIAAQYFIKLIDIFPILIKTAFILVGFAGINILLKISNLNIGFTYLTINKPIPEHVFSVLIFSILIGAMLINKIWPEKFKQ